MANEQTVLFGAERNLVGIVTEPDAAVRANGLGAIFINAGVVHRVGPNRLYVNTARELAHQGFVCARFDLPGIGDSPARRDGMPFEQAAVEETRAVMSRLEQLYGVRRFVLVGLCSGAAVSFKTASADDRVAGAALINPQGFGGSPEWIAYVTDRGQARKYTSKKLFSLRSWRRAITGQSDYRLVLDMVARRWRSLRHPRPDIADFSKGLAGEFRGLTSRGVKLLLACSGGDYSLDYLDVILGAEFRRIDRGTLRIEGLPAGDHSLTMPQSQGIFLAAVRSWAASLEPDARTAPVDGVAQTTAHMRYRTAEGVAIGSSE